MGQCVFLFGQKSNFNCAGLDPHVRKIRPLDGQENEPDFDQLRLLFSCRRLLPSCVLLLSFSLASSLFLLHRRLQPS